MGDIKKPNKFPLVKVSFLLDNGLCQGHETESVWAEKVSDNRCRLRNTPFFAMGVSFEDVVFVNIKNESLWFDRVSIAGGHSTYRIIINDHLPKERAGKYWEPLELLGCSYESIEGNQRLLAVDVPPNADIYKVYALLEKGELDDIWGFEEAHCAHVLNN